MRNQVYKLKRRSVFGIATVILGLCMCMASYAEPVTHTVTERNVDWASAGISGVGVPGTGNITLTGITGTIATARLYWHGISKGRGDGNYDNANVTINGHPVVGSAIGRAPTNCWGDGNSVAYRADVSVHVSGNGVYTIAGMSSGEGHEANGASIVVTFDDGDRANNRDLAYFEGNDSNEPSGFPGEDSGWHAVLEPIKYDGTGTVGIQLHVADGQKYSFPRFSDNTLTFATVNGSVSIPDDDTLWDGLSLSSAGAGRGGDGLYDIHDFDITAAFGGVKGLVALNLDGQERSEPAYDDCLSLILTLVILPPGSAPPPPGW